MLGPKFHFGGLGATPRNPLHGPTWAVVSTYCY
ncbi:hypothetical protein STVIR_2524 [Streptomyces viridochromogenes Tue57]|uniref:Uncharacterized protein n=1 Tax=Streptomyces viridochromogenes Tue57 TaxID=1160705 RepID=L8PJ66_STRVR|nr:hypothetical protein STVIR_2524 [Streptomyces viridochromogenes Tue57]